MSLAPVVKPAPGPEAEVGLSGPAWTRRRKAAAIASVLGAMSLVVLDAGMVNIALPTMARTFETSAANAVLVITAYQTALVMALLPCAALGERFGNRRVFLSGVCLFLVGSVLCAVSPGLPWLVAARLIQGLGGAAVMALGVALLRFTVAPEQLGAAVGWNALTVALSSAAAPTLGALIVGRFDWPWLFLVNLPVGALALAAGLALPAPPGGARRVDPVSIGLNAAGFALLVVSAEALPKSPVLAALGVGAALLVIVGLVRREAPKAAPLIPLDLLRNRSFALSAMASVCCFIGQAAAMVALPFHLQHSLAQSPLMVGLCLSPWPLCVAVTAPIAGRLSNHVASARLCALGGLVLASGLALAALWPPRADPRPFMVFAAICGIGFGLFQAPNNRSLFLAAPGHRSGAAGGMQGTARLTGQTAGAVMMAMLFVALPMSIAPRAGLGLAAAAALLSGIVSARRATADESGGPLTPA